LRRANANETSQASAQERALRLASLVGSHSAPGSRTQSPVHSPVLSPPPAPTSGLPVRVDDIPMIDLNGQRYPEEDEDSLKKEPVPEPAPRPARTTSEAHKLVRAHTKREPFHLFRVISQNSNGGPRSGTTTPTGAQDGEGYVPPPQQYRGGVLSSLLKLYSPPNGGTPSTPGTPGHFPYRHLRAASSSAVSLADHTPLTSPPHSPSSSGAMTPKPKPQKWYYKQNEHKHSSSDVFSHLIGSSSMLASPAAFAGAEADTRDQYKFHTPQRSRAQRGSWGAHGRKNKPRLEDEIKITVHIAEILSRQRYLLKICRALMAYGAPTHRLEEYLKMSARVLEIEGQFLYIPGCMVISFDDPSTHTTEVKLVRTAQGVDLGKLRDTHDVYKEVVHDVIGVEEATQRLDEIMKRKPKNPKWLLILIYGLASASVGPFAFEADWIDLPVMFILGMVLGVLQLIVAPLSDLYANVFEIAAAVLTSFLARAFGSIPRGPHGRMFCFSALAQSSIALILPGYMVLCASLELQSRSIIAGAVRMVNAIIYSLFLGFGITIGSVIYGAMDGNAVSQTKCERSMGNYWGFLFVPIFTLCLLIINQAKWKQAPVMLIISFAGYMVNFFSSKRFPSNAQISQTLGAFTVGVLGNFYSRLRHGVAAAALLPAIFVQVPSGLAAGGSLISGVKQADQIVHNTTTNTTELQTTYNTTGVDDVVYNVGYSMIQVAIGIAVGLSLSAILVYPLGKRRSGLFSF
ncbi:DUF1212-domain-containing protein, partial [Xylona heveae TC161]